MATAFIDRPPSEAEIEKLRLILSTYQDGTGMLVVKGGSTLPGWRDFERAVAACFKGIALESKAIFDVLLPQSTDSNVFYGISCKMRDTLRQVDKDDRVTIELSNAAGEFWDLLKPLGIHQQNYADHAAEVGQSLINRVANWHHIVDVATGGRVITSQSLFLSLQYNHKTGDYQLFQFPIILPNPTQIQWSVAGRHLIGILQDKVIIEWYGFSGGQLKYYPLAANAMWKSVRFKLEPLPLNLEHGLLNKVAAYFPEIWAKIKGSL